MSSGNCMGCSSYNWRDSTCDFTGEAVSAYGWCSNCDADGSESEDDNKICETCSSYSTRSSSSADAWCDYLNCSTSSHGYCRNWS